MVGCTLEQFAEMPGGKHNSEAFLRALDHLRQHGGGSSQNCGVWETVRYHSSLTLI